MRLVVALTFAMSWWAGPLVMATEQKVQPDSSTWPVVIIGASYAGSWPIENIDGRRVLNRGVDGDETDGMLARFDGDVAPHRPEVVLIWGFINDIFRSDPDRMATRIERTKRNIEALVERVAAIGARPVLATEVTLPLYVSWDEWIVHRAYSLIGRTTYQTYVNEHVEDLNRWLRNFAVSRDIVMLDFAAALADGTGARAAKYTQDDGSHLTGAAYQKLTEYVAQLKPGA